MIQECGYFNVSIDEASQMSLVAWELFKKGRLKAIDLRHALESKAAKLNAVQILRAWTKNPIQLNAAQKQLDISVLDLMGLVDRDEAKKREGLVDKATARGKEILKTL